MPKVTSKSAFYRKVNRDTNNFLSFVKEAAEIENRNQASLQHVSNLFFNNCFDESKTEYQEAAEFYDQTTAQNNEEPLAHKADCSANDFSSISDVTINSQLCAWAVDNKISHLGLNKLLKILKPYHPGLPTDSRTLLNTPQEIKIKSVPPGSYCHLGLENAVRFLLSSSKYAHNICEILVNIDGLPISKSSSSQLYPILVSLYSEQKLVSLVGLYHGYGKPEDANIFLRDFVDEAVLLTNNGFLFEEKPMEFKIKAFVADAPAKSYIKCIKGHTGYFSCSKCCIEGEFINNRICFPDLNFVLRTDTDFKLKKYEEHHTGTSILEEIPNLDMVCSFALDYMHLHCLGVMKKLILMWLNGRPPFKLPFIKIKQLSKLLLSQSINIPQEFCRKPRDITEAKRWKATEFRQFLLYTGPVVLKSILPKKYYNNFLAFHLSTLILCNPQSDKTEIDYAHSLLSYFVRSFSVLYGKEHMSHNVHNLLHITTDVKLFGNLDKYSAFPFENFLQHLGKYIRKPNNPIQQIVKRLSEVERSQTNVLKTNSNRSLILQEPHRKPFLGECSSQYAEHCFPNFVLRNKHPNNCCRMKNGNIVIIENFATNSENEIVVIGKQFKIVDNFYTEPCESSFFKTFKVSQLNYVFESWPVSEVDLKYVKLNIEEDIFIVIPLLHTEKNIEI